MAKQKLPAEPTNLYGNFNDAITAFISGSYSKLNQAYCYIISGRLLMESRGGR